MIGGSEARLAFVLLALLLFPVDPSPAFAHASDRGFILLLPTGYYIVGGAMAVAVSFAVLLLLPGGAAQSFTGRRLRLVALPRALLDRARFWTSLASFAVLCILVAAGFFGSRDPLSNPLPLTMWTLVWIGLAIAQGIIGNVWWWVGPWHAPAAILGRAVAGIAGRDTLFTLPPGVGVWPAVALMFGFAWFELIYPAPDDPYRLAVAVLAYAGLTLGGIALFGGSWLQRCEFLTVFFTLLSRFSALGSVTRNGRVVEISLYWPGAKLLQAPSLPPGGTGFLLLALASVSFDGFSRTFAWMSLNGINPLEFPGRTAMMGTNTAGLVGAIILLWLAFHGALWLGRQFAGNPSALLASRLVWSIVPIALAYHFAHYLTAFLVNGQYALVALSDPFSEGLDLFGTADNQVTAGIVMGSESVWLLWNLQAGAIIVGHVVAVFAAHMLSTGDRPFPSRSLVVELPLTMLMIAYTVFGLWLLSTPTAV